MLAQGLADARAGAGSVVVLEAPAGKGKSRLLRVAGDMARATGLQVLVARGSHLERDFPFGVAIQLFEPRWVATAPGDRARLLDGPARLAGSLLDGEALDPLRSPEDQGYPLIHGMFWLACNLAMPPGEDPGGGPLVMLVDDAQCADQPSLRFLAYLAERLADLPIMLVVCLSRGDISVDPQAVQALRDAPATTMLRPGPLSKAGVDEVVRAQFPDAEPEFCEACIRVTHGNPYLLVELLAQVRADKEPPDAETAERLADLAPESVLQAVVARLGAMAEPARALASAVAVLGDGASLQQAALLAGLDLDSVRQAADALAAVNILHPGEPLSFVHALIGSAVAASVSALARADAHRRAAMILLDEGSSAESVAAHLLEAAPDTDPRAVEALRSAARTALVSGDASAAVRFLGRALAERPADEMRADLLAELGQAEASAGLPQAARRLEQAISITEKPERRAQLSLALGRVVLAQRRYREAAAVFDAALAELNGRDAALADELQAAYISAASLAPALAAEAATRQEGMLAQIGDEPAASQRAALVSMAVRDSLVGKARAGVIKQAELAWGDGALLEAETADGRSWRHLTAALLFVDELERGIEICDAALADARRLESPIAYARASQLRALPLYAQGRILDALADAQAAAAVHGDALETDTVIARAALALCHLQRGPLEAAEQALAMIDDPAVRDTVQRPYLLDVRARLRLAQRRPQEALEDATRAGEHLQSHCATTSPGVVAWRSTAALAHLALGNTNAAVELAAEELELARRAEVTRVVIRDLRILGLAERGDGGIELLAEAVDTGERYPARLDYIQALVDLGAALRRANRRAAAREPLRRGLELSSRGGAIALASHARTELAAAGGRPRSIMLSGVESLTPSERRVADLAAEGLTTRQIAEALFVTPKTVEFHLRHTYQKLEISSRTQLADALADVCLESQSQARPDA